MLDGYFDSFKSRDRRFFQLFAKVQNILGRLYSLFLAHLVMSLCNHALSVVVGVGVGIGIGVCVQLSQ